MKKEITIEEYNQTLKTLTLIDNEKKLLKNLYHLKIYQYHPIPSETIDELLLVIKKEKEYLELQINKKKKEYLLNLTDIPNIAKNQNLELNNIIEQISNNLLNKNKKIDSSLALLPNFSTFYQQITPLIINKQNYIKLENYILTLKYQESIALKIKKYYEKNAKKSLPKKRLLKK